MMMSFGGFAEDIERYYILWFRDLFETNLKYDRTNENKTI